MIEKERLEHEKRELKLQKIALENDAHELEIERLAIENDTHDLELFKLALENEAAEGQTANKDESHTKTSHEKSLPPVC